MPGKANLLEVAVELNNRKFVAHRFSQGVVEEIWNGRSPACGRVRLRTPRPAVGWLMLQLFVPFVHMPGVSTEINDLYRWPVREERDAINSFNSRYSKKQVLEVSVTALQHVMGLLHIPIFKRVFDCLSHLAFCVLFFIVAFR